MNPLWKNIVILIAGKDNKGRTPQSVSQYKLAKSYTQSVRNFKRLLKDAFLILLGIFSASFGFKGFLLTNRFIDGGATGISLLFNALTNVPLALLIIIINTPFVYLGYKILGKLFAVKATLAIAGLALCLATVQFPDVTKDNLLVAVFGGMFLGAGIGLAIRGGAVIDGTEILAIYLSKKTGATIGDVIVLINLIIFSAAAYFLGIDIALYSLITYLAASKTLDFVIEGIEEYTGVTIISSHSSQVTKMIVEKLGRGVTVYNGKGGYTRQGIVREIEIVFTVITRLELNKLNGELAKIDPNAFIIMHSVKDTKGGMIKQRSLKH